MNTERRSSANWPFYLGFGLLGGLYLVLILGMLVADLVKTSPLHFANALSSPEIRYSVRLSLISCSISAILSIWVAVPLGYLLSRTQFIGKPLLDTILDIPIVIPPVVVGLSLLILFQTSIGQYIQRFIPVTFAIPSVVIAQFTVAAAFAVRTMRVTFDQIPQRTEHVAWTLGCNRSQAFWRVTFPQARRGLLSAFTLAWARSLGEFGPILIFSGAIRKKTEVLTASVFLELSVGRLEAALAVSLLMVLIAVVVLLITRAFGLRGAGLV